MKNRLWLHVVCALAIGLLAFAPCRNYLLAQENPGPPQGEPRDDRFDRGDFRSYEGERPDDRRPEDRREGSDRDPGPNAEGRLQRLMKAIQFLRDQGFPKEADLIGRELKQAPRLRGARAATSSGPRLRESKAGGRMVLTMSTWHGCAIWQSPLNTCRRPGCPTWPW